MSSNLRHARIWSGIGWAGVIAATTLSLMPHTVLQANSLNDKFEHAVGYALLTIWFCGIYPWSRYRVIAPGFLLLGITIEALQGAMRWGRQGDIHDIYANAAGIALGVLLARFTPVGDWARWVETLLARRQTE